MSDRVDREIRTAIVELVESSPPPHPAHRVLSSARSNSPLTLRSGLMRMGVVAVAVLMVGLAGAWVGRNLVSSEPATSVPIVEGTLGPQPQFDPAETFGAEELSLLPSGGELRPETSVEGSPVGDVVAVGRVPDTGREIFTWETTTDGTCLQVVGEGFNSSACSSEPADGTQSNLVNRPPFLTTHQNPDTGEEEMLAAWPVPDEAAVVVFAVGEDLFWQRPKGDVAAMAVDVATPRVILQAFDANQMSLVSTSFSPVDELDPAERGETTIEAAPEDLVEVGPSNSAVEILDGGATTVESFSDAARERDLDFSCGESRGPLPYGLCLVGTEEILVMVPFDAPPGTTARLSDPGLSREVVMPLDRTEPVGVRNLEGSRLEVIVEYYGEEIGSMSAPMLVDGPD